MKKQWLFRAISETRTITRSSKHFTRTICSNPSSNFSVKRVTRKNFDSALEDLRRHVREADFVSVDLEMTGVTSAPWRESLDFDRFDIHYLKVKDSVEKFAVVQFGVCSFRWDISKQSFIAHPYTFYVFPRKELPFDAPAYEFLCQTASLDFLAKYQFDFNACVHEGISYLSRAQEGEALSRLNMACQDEVPNSGGHLREAGESQLLSIADILFTERMKGKFRKWRDALLWNKCGKSQSEDNSNNSKAELQTVFFKMRPSIKLDGFTSHQHRLIQLVIRKFFKDLAYVRVIDEDSLKQKLVVYTDSEEDRQLLMKEVKADLCKGAELKINAAVGFRHVIDLLSSERKLVIGHNCFLDITHIYSKFIGPLPSTVEEFASSVHKEFPSIIDTKYLLKADHMLRNLMKKTGTSLSSAFLLLCPQLALVSGSSVLVSSRRVKVEVQVDDIRSSECNSGTKHEAGYDAFMTGCVFSQACSHLGIDFNSHSPSKDLTHNEKLQKYMNHLYISNNNGAIIELSSGKQIPEPWDCHKRKQQYPKIEYQNIILLWGFASKLKPKELKDSLTKVFGLDSVTSVYYLDQTAAFVQFRKEELVTDFLALKETLERNNDPISVLHPLATLFEGGKTRAARYEVYKEICSSAISRIMFAEQAETVTNQQKAREARSSEVGTESLGSSCSTKPESDETSCEGTQHSPSRDFPYSELMDTLCSARSQ